jgi:hypothetical protein
VDVMKATRTCVAARRFQYDYLNDDITGDGRIDYRLTNKVPESLRKAIADGKKILVLINPPYAESGSGVESGNKAGVATTKISNSMIGYGFAKRELVTQFLARIKREVPTATIAMFSTLKYVVAPNFDEFRQIWFAKFLGGFAVHNKAFDGLNGNFPIGFLVWKTSQDPNDVINELCLEIFDKTSKPIGEKMFFSSPTDKLLTKWIDRPKPNTILALPLKNAIFPATKTHDIRGCFWSDNAIGSLYAHASDLQNANLTALLSSGYSSPGAFFVNPDNLWQAAIVFTVRRIIKQTWLNDRDQFLQPTEPLTEEFKTDCLIWMLFNGSNLTASANNLEWNGKKWSIVNHFIPFTESEVGAPDRFESDFMVRYLAGKSLSDEANQVLMAGKALWQAYFAHTDVRVVRDELKLNRADVGWYQVRKALQARNASGDFTPVSFKPFEEAYKALTEKLQPQVYELGFLRN